MTPKERVITTLAHKEPDLVPWGEHSIDYNIYEMILGRKSLTHAKFKETKAYWEGRRDEVAESYKRDYVDLALALGMDILTVTMLPAKDYRPTPLTQIDDLNYKDAEGHIYRYSHITEDLFRFPMNTASVGRNITMDDAEAMLAEAEALPPLDPNPDIPEYEAINHVVKTLGKTHFVIAPINGLEWPRFGETEEDSWVNLLMEPEITGKLAAAQTARTIRELDRLAATGIDGVLNVGDLGNTTNLAAPPAIYREFIYPYHQRIFEECKKRGLYVMRHCCGHVWPIMDELCSCNDSYEAIQEYAGMDIVKLKEQYGDRITLWGGVKHENIHGMGPEEIRRDIERSCRHAAPGGGFILGSSHSLTLGATVENLMAIKQYRAEYGGYPIRL